METEMRKSRFTDDERRQRRNETAWKRRAQRKIGGEPDIIRTVNEIFLAQYFIHGGSWLLP
jgi:hypothetical protein